MGFILKAAVAAASVAALLPLSLLGDAIEKKLIPLDMNMVRRHDYFGYSPEEVQKLYGQPLEIDFDTTGEAMDRIQPPPKPLVHPRILFNPEDIPAIRTRLEQTKSGKLQMDAIRLNIKKFVTGPKAVFAADYQRLIDGDDSVDVNTPSGDSSKLNLTYNLMYEAFRCLIDNDADGGKKVAAAITTLARIDKRAVETNMAKELKKAKPGEPDVSHDFRVVAESATQEGTLGLMYDFAYNWMNDQQRSIVRDACAKASDGMTNIGCETLYGQTTNTSNWITWSARLIFPTLAIEGEPGYDPSTYARCVYAYRGIVVRGIFAGGEGYEGMGKFFTFNEHMIAMAKRGENVIAATHLHDAFHNYFIASLNPWGEADTFYDSLGGTNDHVSRNADILAYKFLYPKDKAVDYVYRNNIKPDYSNFGQPVNTRHPFLATEALVSALYAQDYDQSMTNAQERGEVTASMPLTYFSQDTCNMITRSSWDDRALYLNYLNRAVRGGHQYSDRSHFSIYADGRYWGIYRHLRQVGEQFTAKNRSLILVDGEGSTTGPGKCVAFVDKPMASFIASDLKPTYDYIADGVIPSRDRSKIVMMPFSSDDFRLNPSDLAFMNLPLDAGADWYTSRKPYLWGLDGGTPPPSKNNLPPPSVLWHQADIPMRKAFRTAGMVRGPHPYVLIIDDIQKDDQTRDYSWGMTVADDVLLGQPAYDSDSSHFRLDVILNEKPVVASAKRSDDDAASTELPGKDRHLMIRVLDGANVDTTQPGTLETVTDSNAPMKPIAFPKLCIHSKSSDPHFKMLLVPFRDGQPLPTTTWNADKTALTIRWPDQSDVVTFSPTAGGRTGLQIQREGQSLIAMK
jgi:hypothetical protein